MKLSLTTQNALPPHSCEKGRSSPSPPPPSQPVHLARIRLAPRLLNDLTHDEVQGHSLPALQPAMAAALSATASRTAPARDLHRAQEEAARAVTIGRDGLIVTKGPYTGLLRPRVAPEWGFDSQEFLSQACVKAGLLPDARLDEDTKVQHFQAQIFAEVAPG